MFKLGHKKVCCFGLFSALVLFGILLISCTSAKSTITPSTETKYLTQTAEAFTPTHIPTSFLYITATPKPTKTPRPTYEPTATRTPTATRVVANIYNLPDWMANPELDIVMTITDWAGNGSQLSFFGEQIEQRFDILLPVDIKGYFWLDNQHFGLLEDDDRTLYSIDLGNGQVTTHYIDFRSTRLIRSAGTDMPYALQVNQNEPESDDFLFITSYFESEFSKDWSYIAQREILDEDGYTTLNEVKTGSIITLTSTTDKLWDTYFAWSPITPEEIVIAQSSTRPSMYFYEAEKIKVFNVESGLEVKSLPVDLDYSFNMSADGSQVLYKKTYGDIPCILNLQTGVNRCLYSIPDSHYKSDYESWGVDLFRWNRNSQYIYYVFYYYDYYIEGYYKGGFCTYDLHHYNISCPVDNIKELTGQTIINYSTSPDERFIIFRSECRTIGSDMGCDPRVSMTRMDGKDFRWLIEQGYTYPESLETILWRPLQ